VRTHSYTFVRILRDARTRQMGLMAREIGKTKKRNKEMFSFTHPHLSSLKKTESTHTITIKGLTLCHYELSSVALIKCVDILFFRSTYI